MVRYVQTMSVQAGDPEALEQLLTTWHEAEAGIAPGYIGSRLLADRDHPGRYMILVDFSSAEEAEKNNDRPETQEWAAKLGALIESDAAFGNFDEVRAIG